MINFFLPYLSFNLIRIFQFEGCAKVNLEKLWAMVADVVRGFKDQADKAFKRAMAVFDAANERE